MEENAKITNITENTPENTPEIQDDGMLSVDDLVLEIGRLHVEKMSFDKKLKIINLKHQPTKTMIDSNALIKSNNQYQENNRVLDLKLVETRNKLEKIEIKNKELISEVKQLSEKIDTLENELLKNVEIDSTTNNKNIDEITVESTTDENNVIKKITSKTRKTKK